MAPAGVLTATVARAMAVVLTATNTTARHLVARLHRMMLLVSASYDVERHANLPAPSRTLPHRSSDLYPSAVGTGSELAIRVENLTRRFATVTAVSDLNLEIPAGTVFGFLGPNGAGKTTTIRLLLGLVEPTAGRAEVLGHDVAVHADDVRRGCGVLLEHTGVYERLSAVDNLEYYGRLWGIPAAERRARIAELLDHFGLASRGSETTGTWSRGMKQKVALARALLHRPKLVLLDEPTAGLDPVAAVALRSDLLGLARREGVTIFITTHNLDEAERICDRVAVIRAGHLVAEGTPASLRGHVERPTVSIRGTGLAPLQATIAAQADVVHVEVADDRMTIDFAEDVPVAPLIRLLVEGGAGIEEVHRSTASLEDAFLALLSEPEAAP